MFFVHVFCVLPAWRNKRLL